ncbi:MAG: DUF2948 family protein [Pseudomonadota bacterium]
MVKDAFFEDGEDRPIRLMAVDGDDLQVVSSLVQDAVVTPGDLSWRSSERRFALLINRYRWEIHSASAQLAVPAQRVRTILVFDDVIRVATQGFDRTDQDLVLSLLSVSWTAAEDGGGEILLTMAGFGAVLLTCECVNAVMQDVTSPYAAASGRAPEHPQ